VTIEESNGCSDQSLIEADGIARSIMSKYDFLSPIVASPYLYILKKHSTTYDFLSEIFHSIKKNTKIKKKVKTKYLSRLKMRRKLNVPSGDVRYDERRRVLIISHALDGTNFSEPDLYFHGIVNWLEANGICVLMAYIDHSHGKDFSHECLGNNKIILPKRLSYLSELWIMMRIVTSFQAALFIEFIRFGFSRDFDVLLRLAYSRKQFLSLSGVRIQKQIKAIIREVTVSDVIITYEGHPWERLVSYILRKEKIGVAGYIHSVACDCSFGIARSFANDYYNPKIILHSSSAVKNYFERMHHLNDEHFLKNSIVIGTHKYRDELFQAKDYEKLNLLFVPEGIDVEYEIFFEIISVLVNSYIPNINITFRPHPQLISGPIVDKLVGLRRNHPNLSVSYQPFQKDLFANNYVFFRGSAAAVEAVQSKLFPIYIEHRLQTCDPLAMISSCTLRVNSDTNFKSFFYKLPALAAEYDYPTYFTKFDPSGLVAVFKK